MVFPLVRDLSSLIPNSHSLKVPVPLYTMGLITEMKLPYRKKVWLRTEGLRRRLRAFGQRIMALPSNPHQLASSNSGNEENAPLDPNGSRIHRISEVVSQQLLAEERQRAASMAEAAASSTRRRGRAQSSPDPDPVVERAARQSSKRSQPDDSSSSSGDKKKSRK